MATLIQDNRLMEVSAVADLIKKGKILVLSGEGALLKQLPKGNWIGGTIPYFYFAEEQGRMDKSKIFVTDFTDLAEEAKVVTYKESDLKNVAVNGYENGFNFLILPALRDIHFSFALNSPEYPNLFSNPLIGLVAGADLAEFTTGKLSETFNGQTGESYTDNAVALHVELPSHKVARLEIVNVFEPSNSVAIEVEQDSFVIKDCLINGKKTNLYTYIKENQLDISYPLVSDYEGATVNVSFQRLDDDKKEVVFYAPLFKGRKYSTSKAFANYTAEFNNKVKVVFERESNIVYNCNCILNYLYGALDKNSIGFSGATTFGEVAYQLLNQTFTYLSIDEA